MNRQLVKRGVLLKDNKSKVFQLTVTFFTSVFVTLYGDYMLSMYFFLHHFFLNVFKKKHTKKGTLSKPEFYN